ncbi:MAG: phosphonoacetaldehyde hydrolase [Planctomycetaceae bacterium TMED240]|nr:phosphonoacetaldehyde hydrolase [Rhodopirellula sp.]OUX03819.1 MAG: phosphonoacetaldehyde hydrolase [Planctomycetaceae bacterium TMED240]
MTDKYKHMRGVVLDWAGTMVDYGSRAPASVFQETFRGRGVEITVAQAREPMGMAKLDHIATIAAMPAVADAWLAKYGQPCTTADIEAMYADFLPLQLKILDQHCDLIEGAAEAVDELRSRGLKIGSSTGYTRQLMEVVSAAATPQGYTPDCVLCAEDAPRGRPAPFLLYEAAMRLDIYPMTSIVKVDDTAVGIQAGRNAGCWTVGITRTGNCVGLSRDEWKTLSEQERKEKCEAAATTLTAAGAHEVIESVADLPAVVNRFEQKLCNGQRPD